jgi:hypothetical protein
MAEELVEMEAPEPDETLQHEEEESAKKILDAVKEREHSFATGKSGWWKDAEEAMKLFTLEESCDEPFNILYSNTEVLLPSLYSAVPKPDVRSRFPGAGMKAVPELLERFLTLAADDSTPGLESFHSAMEESTLSALTAGGGFIRIRYEDTAAFPLRFESVFYKNFVWAAGRKWAKLPWVAFKHEMSKADFAEKFGVDEEKMATSIEVEDSEDDAGEAAVTVYEVWHKPTKEVWFVSENWAGTLVRKDPDPMKLADFFPIPGILDLTRKPGTIRPTPLYMYYKRQAEELNRVSTRLNKVLEAVKVRGAYSSLLGDDLKNLLSNDDKENALVEAQNGQMLAQFGGFEKAIWLLPIEKLIQVAGELYKARESIKQVIYELTGISDIIRGASVASETATAQDLKNKWGTVRLRKMQTTVSNYARDLFRLAVDCGSQVMPPEQWKMLTQIDLPLTQEKQVAQQQMQYTQQMAQMTGQQPPPPDPKMMALMQKPSIEETIAAIRDDKNRVYTVNIQTSSTIDLDTASDKSEVTEFMNAFGQLLSGLQPLMQLGPQGLTVAKEIGMAVASRFKFGLSIVDVLAKMEIPQPPPQGQPQPDPKLEAEKAKAQVEMQVAQAQAQATMAQIELDKQLAQEKAALAREQLAVERELLQISVAEARMKAAATQQKLAMQRAQQPREAKNANVRS